MDELIDEHCTKIYIAWIEGLCTREEAEKQMSIHGDRLIYEMLENGFKCLFTVDKKDLVGLTGSTGTA